MCCLILSVYKIEASCVRDREREGLIIIKISHVVAFNQQTFFQTKQTKGNMKSNCYAFGFLCLSVFSPSVMHIFHHLFTSTWNFFAFMEMQFPHIWILLEFQVKSIQDHTALRRKKYTCKYEFTYRKQKLKLWDFGTGKLQSLSMQERSDINTTQNGRKPIQTRIEKFDDTKQKHECHLIFAYIQ